MKISFVSGTLALGLSLMSCSHGHTRGSIVFTDSNKEGHVCIGRGEVNPGDTVNVYKSVCKSQQIPRGEKGDFTRTLCEKHLVGTGKIVEFSGEHFARIKAVGDLKLEDGLIVERITK